LKSITLAKKSALKELTVNLPASKSISNRALIIKALAKSKGPIKNLSEARDTVTMQKLLNSDADTLDVLDAGTTMRFLCAYLSISDQQKILTGTNRMQQRPIKILVDALKEIGANINYIKNEGYPPVEIMPFIEQKTRKISIRGDVSSQYISALMMIAPTLPAGLELHLEGKISSIPYLKMTQNLMESFGVRCSWSGNTMSITNQKYTEANIVVEPDWSAASYWYSFVALSENATAFIKNLAKESIQGDSVISEIMFDLGVATKFADEGAYLKKSSHKNSFEYDFSDCPDLAQTVAVICAAKGIPCKMTGLESLKIKETDRVLALQNELKKLGAQLIEENRKWTLKPSNNLPEKVTINTYEDHRMAMAFAPLLTMCSVTIEDREVVNKSYPTFWRELQKNNIL